MFIIIQHFYMNQTNYRVSDISNAIKVSDVKTYDDPKILEFEQSRYGGPLSSITFY